MRKVKTKNWIDNSNAFLSYFEQFPPDKLIKKVAYKAGKEILQRLT